MANAEHMRIVRAGPEAIKKWRPENPGVRLDLLSANLSKANLIGANLEKAALGFTTFGDCDLSGCRGLDSINHQFSSTIGVDTLVRTFKAGGHSFSRDVQKCLLEAGVPRELLDGLPALLREIKYQSCFIAYGEPDKPFAQKLYKDLRAKGVQCWVFFEDATPGVPLAREVNHRVRDHDKVIVTCSVPSLVRDGLKQEIEDTVDEDPNKLLPVSLDDTWTSDGFAVKIGARDIKPSLIKPVFVDFIGWEKDGRIYQNGLAKLLKALET